MEDARDEVCVETVAPPLNDQIPQKLLLSQSVPDRGAKPVLGLYDLVRKLPAECQPFQDALVDGVNLIPEFFKIVR